MATWADVRHSLLGKLFSGVPSGPLRGWLARFCAERYPDDFERWCDETGRDPDVVRALIGARYRFDRRGR
jgi:hypothetical protein